MKEDIEVFRTYLFTVAYNILGEVEEAEDLVQESFVYFISLKEDHVSEYKILPYQGGGGESFDFPYSELALICKTTETNCRKIFSRARQKVSKPVYNPGNMHEQLMPLIQTFLKAVVDEDISALATILKEEIVLYSDGGGKVAAALHPLYGRVVVSKFIMGLRKKTKETN